MQMMKIAYAMIATLVLAACSAGPAGISLRQVPDPVACPAAALPVPIRFVIDPLAKEQVTAIASDGRTYLVLWSPGFVGGTAADPVVRAPNGDVVLRDGEVLKGELLHGYTVCASGDSLYVLLV